MSHNLSDENEVFSPEEVNTIFEIASRQSLNRQDSLTFIDLQEIAKEANIPLNSLEHAVIQVKERGRLVHSNKSEVKGEPKHPLTQYREKKTLEPESRRYFWRSKSLQKVAITTLAAVLGVLGTLGLGMGFYNISTQGYRPGQEHSLILLSSDAIKVLFVGYFIAQQFLGFYLFLSSNKEDFSPRLELYLQMSLLAFTTLWMIVTINQLVLDTLLLEPFIITPESLSHVSNDNHPGFIRAFGEAVMIWEDAGRK